MSKTSPSAKRTLAQIIEQYESELHYPEPMDVRDAHAWQSRRYSGLKALLLAPENERWLHMPKAKADLDAALSVASHVATSGPDLHTWAGLLAEEGVRPEVLRFAVLMERKLKANDHKGHWDGCDLDYLLKRLREEVVEVERLHYGTSAVRPDEFAAETADVANFAMMIADNTGALPRVPPLRSATPTERNSDIADRLDEYSKRFPSPVSGGVAAAADYVRSLPSTQRTSAEHEANRWGERLNWIHAKYGVDGSGTESGDPLDVIEAEIKQALGKLEDALEEAALLCEGAGGDAGRAIGPRLAAQIRALRTSTSATASSDAERIIDGVNAVLVHVPGGYDFRPFHRLRNAQPIYTDDEVNAALFAVYLHCEKKRRALEATRS